VPSYASYTEPPVLQFGPSRVPRSKSGKPHAVPLNARAYAALQRLWGARGESPYAFANAKGPKAGEALKDLPDI
jgi:integrase